ncbi:MAG: cohesin domain-containing protein [Chloroflexota bacterium]
MSKYYTKVLVIMALVLTALPMGTHQTQAAELEGSILLANAPQQTNTCTIGTVTVDAGDGGSVDISLNNQDAVASAQIEIRYDNSNGVTLTGVNITARTSGFQTNFSESTSGSTTTVTILMFNLTGTTIAAGDGAILTLDFTTTAGLSATTLEAASVLLSDSSGNALSAAGVDGLITPPGVTPVLTAITPSNGGLGETVNVQITGENVNWTTNPPTNVSFGAGITVNGNATVVNDSTLSVDINIAINATVGPRTVTVTAGGQDVSLVNGFVVQGPGIGIIMPTDAESYPGGNFTIPVSVTTDVTGEGILAYAFTLTYDAMIRLQSVGQAGTMSDNWSVTTNREAGEARIVAFSDTPLTGSGTLLNLTFDVSPGATVGAETDIAFNAFRFNEGEPAAQTQSGHFTVITQPATIAGCVTPVHDFSQVVAGLPISFTNMLSGAQDVVVTTDADGCYSAELAPSDYVATPAKTGVISNAITVWDSVQIALHDANLEDSNFSDHQLMVCDVTQDGTCTAFDAAQIALYRIDPALTDSIAGQFVSNPYTRTHTGLGDGDSLASQDYELYLAGDVTLDWPANTQNSLVRAAARTAEAVVVTAPSVTSAPNRTMNVPIAIQNVAQQDLYGIELFLTFDPEIMTVNGVSSGDSADAQWVLQNIVDASGEVRIVSYSTMPLADDGTLVNLSVTVNGDVGEQTALSISHLLINDGQPVTEHVDGGVTVVEQEPLNLKFFLPIVSN